MSDRACRMLPPAGSGSPQNARSSDNQRQKGCQVREVKRFDVRGKPLQQARHWSAPEIFGPRAHFNTDTDPATLDIQPPNTPRSLKPSFGE
uniref:Uncharacterized protein n=1 Tax=Anopheles albimanus TaxID=7167 RepID=A0A182F247_ANOAL